MLAFNAMLINNRSADEEQKEGGLTMAKVMMGVLSIAFLFGCATTAPEEHSGMKRIPKSIGVQSLEKKISVNVIEFGYICPTVADIYVLRPDGLIVTCFDGKTSVNYRYVESKDKQWYSVTPTDEERPAVSLETSFQMIIYGHGFNCSKVTDIVEIQRGEIYQVTCIEGKYKVVTENKTGRKIISPW